MLSEAYSFIPYITPSNFANEEVNQLYKQMEQEEQERQAFKEQNNKKNERARSKCLRLVSLLNSQH